MKGKSRGRCGGRPKGAKNKPKDIPKVKKLTPEEKIQKMNMKKVVELTNKFVEDLANDIEKKKVEQEEKALKDKNDKIATIQLEKERKAKAEQERLEQAAKLKAERDALKGPTIFDKYRKQLNMVKSGYLRDLSYADAMEILRFTEKKLNIQIPMNYSCGNCLMKLVEMFANLEKKINLKWKIKN